MRDCRYCAKWEVCPSGKQGHDNGSSIGYSAGECKDYKPTAKAWVCSADWEGYVAIVFAETAGKARYHAMQYELLGDGLDFRDITVYRERKMDAHYRGVPEMDWDNEQDRMAMVQELGFSCDDDAFDPDDCKKCPAAELCDKYQDWLEEEQEVSE